MAVIRIAKFDFSLDGHPEFLPFLDKTGLSAEDFNGYIKPFVESLMGDHYAEGPKLKRMGVFPKRMFAFSNLSFSKVFNYSSKEDGELILPIKDRYSFQFASQEPAELSEDQEQYIHRGLAVTFPDCQMGSFNFSKNKGIETRLVKLDKIKENTYFVKQGTISNHLVEEILA